MATIQTNWFKHSDEAITERIFSQNTFSLKVTELYVVLQKKMLTKYNIAVDHHEIP